MDQYTDRNKNEYSRQEHKDYWKENKLYEQQKLWWEFHCPECKHVWESDQGSPDREWCKCGTVLEPELIYYPWWVTNSVEVASNANGHEPLILGLEGPND